MKCALVIGGGPTGLMAAETLASEGVAVSLCEAKPSVGRKFLMAGKSGLNLTKDENFEPFLSHFADSASKLRPILTDFDGAAVQEWARGLGQEVFTGSSGRVFPTAMKASPLLRAWLARLDDLGVRRNTRWKWTGWDGPKATFDTPDGSQGVCCDVTILALGGASWARLGSDGAWAPLLREAEVGVAPFAASNAGLVMNWSSHMTAHMGASLKAVSWRAGDLVSRGEAVISRSGLEGGGIYTLTPEVRRGAPLFVDLAPDIPADRLRAELENKPAKLRLAHWLKNTRRLSPAKVALFFEMTAGEVLDRGDWGDRLKNLPVRHSGLRPMDEAISTAGGVQWRALTPDLMLKNRPGVFCAGEMLDWEAPTGGYLITASLATGRWAAKGALSYLAAAA